MPHSPSTSLPQTRYGPFLTGLDWVAWRIEATGCQRVSTGCAATRTHDALAQFALDYGCLVLEGSCCALGAGDYCSWVIVSPRVENSTMVRGYPNVVQATASWLRSQVPEAVDWSIQVDEEATWQFASTELVRDVYADLIDPLEVALLGMRTGDAVRREPTVTYLPHSPGALTGSGSAIYTLWLAEPGASREDGGIAIVAGVATRSADLPAQMRGLVGADESTWPVASPPPRLPVPRPPRPLWVVSDGYARWFGMSVEDVLERVVRDLRRLYPELGDGA